MQRIRDVLGPLVIDMLSTGAPVVLDFPANTPVDRHWLRSLADAAKVPHRVHYVEVDDDTCRRRLHHRNARGEHDFAATDAEFDLITSYFRAPDQAEGLDVVMHRI